MQAHQSPPPKKKKAKKNKKKKLRKGFNKETGHTGVIRHRAQPDKRTDHHPIYVSSAAIIPPLVFLFVPH